LEWLRNKVHVAGGGDYTALINAVLKEYVQSNQEPFEQILRRVVREELASSYRTKPKRRARAAA